MYCSWSPTLLYFKLDIYADWYYRKTTIFYSTSQKMPCNYPLHHSGRVKVYWRQHIRGSTRNYWHDAKYGWMEPTFLIHALPLKATSTKTQRLNISAAQPIYSSTYINNHTHAYITCYSNNFCTSFICQYLHWYIASVYGLSMLLEEQAQPLPFIGGHAS